MPYLNNTVDNRMEYESTVGNLQSVIDRNLGCNFVIGGDFNVSKSQHNASVAALENLCALNGISWLEPVSSSVNYTYHADTAGNYSLIDHILVSQHMVDKVQSVVIHVDDHNLSDHYAISTSLAIEVGNMRKHSPFNNKTLKYIWNRGDICEYADVLGEQLSRVYLPKNVLVCNGVCGNDCAKSIDQYYSDIVRCLITASNSCIPISKSKHKKHWWNDELDDLKHQTIAATTFWRSVGCPRSGPVNENRLQCKYRYKLAIKQAEKNASQEFNEEYFSAKNDTSFWKAWRKRYCSSSIKTTDSLNGKQGDTNVCNEFTDEFLSVFQTNTVNSDCAYKEELVNLIESANHDTNAPKIDIDLCHQCIRKMKLNKSPGFDSVSTEHLLYGGKVLCVHLCLLFNTVLQHCYVPEEFSHGVIVPLLKDKHGDQTRSDMYRGITLSPTIAKLF